MASETSTFPHPDTNLKPLRVNILAALLEPKTGHVFVGDLLPRANNRRGYEASMVEGGVDKNEALPGVFGREIIEESGFTNITFLAAAKKPLVCYFDDWSSPDAKYSGKIYLPAAFVIHDIREMNLDPGIDPEGATFGRGQFLPLHQAHDYLMQKTSSPLRKIFIEEVTALLQPVASALAMPRRNAADVNSASLEALLSPKNLQHLTTQMPSIYPAPDPASLMLPIARPETVGASHAHGKYIS